VIFVEDDFTDDDPGRRRAAAGHDPTVASLYVLEGVAVYLDVAVLEAVLASLRSSAAPASTPAVRV
jgi:O-methyltransferase involved in polyketide biosynthesis